MVWSSLAQLAALTTGGGLNLANAQAWPGEITWDLLVGTNTIRNLHFAAPLSASLENEIVTLSLAYDSYSIAQTDAAIATVVSLRVWCPTRRPRSGTLLSRPPWPHTAPQAR